MANHRPRLTPKQRETKRVWAAAMYKSGLPTAKIAERLGCSPGTARFLLLEAGVTLRSAGGHRVGLPDGMLTSDETAELMEVGRGSLAAMRHRGEGPPTADRPAGAHGHYVYYWRDDVEKWVAGRAESRIQRIQEHAEARQAQRESPVPRLLLDWPALLEAVDVKRAQLEMSWQGVSRATGVDASVISRIRSGREPAKGLSSFTRLAFWVCGYIPEELKRFTREP